VKTAVPADGVAILRPTEPSALTSQMSAWRSSHSVSAVSGMSWSASQSTYCSVRWHVAPIASDMTRTTLFGTLASAPGRRPRIASRTALRTSRRVGVVQGMKFSAR
jgi:hypothetical protein